MYTNIVNFHRDEDETFGSLEKLSLKIINKNKTFSILLLLHICNI